MSNNKKMFLIRLKLSTLKMLIIGESSADKYITKVLYITGLWFDKSPSLPYRMHSFILLFIIMLMWVICLDIGFVLTNTLAKATHALCVSLPVSVFFAKAMNLYVYNQRIQDCLSRVQNFPLFDSEEKKFVNKQLSMFFKFTIFYALICNLTITFVSWSVMLDREPVLPFAAWYPGLNWQHNNRDFWIAHSIQFYGMFIAVNINLTCELFPCYFLTVISCLLDVLGMRLQKLNEKSTKNVKGNSKIENENSKIEKLIDGNVETHYYIMKLTEDVQQCYNFPFFVEICTVGVTVTANAFQLSFLVARSKLGDHDIAEYAHYITYIACTVFRIFLPCYFGNLVLSASEALSFRLFSSEWLDMSILCRKKLIILMERMKRPTVIWAWVLFPLTLAIFKSIMNFSYTMLTLLQNLN